MPVVKVVPDVPMEDMTDTRIPAWDPLIGHIIHVAKAWGPRPEFNLPGIVSEGADAVLGMAVAYEQRDEEYEFFKAVRTALPDLPAVAEKFGDSPGGPGYMEVPINDGDERVTLGFAHHWGEDIATNVAEVWWTDNGGDVDVVRFDATVERAVAAVRFMVEKRKHRWQNAPEE